MAKLAVEDDTRRPIATIACQPLGELLARGVDDLVKFRVLAFLCRRPAAAGDAHFFAQALGLWSDELTEAALAEMARVGILERREWPGGLTIYALSPPATPQDRLCAVCALDGAEAWERTVFAQLAARSLRRLRPRRPPKLKGLRPAAKRQEGVRPIEAPP